MGEVQPPTGEWAFITTGTAQTYMLFGPTLAGVFWQPVYVVQNKIIRDESRSQTMIFEIGAPPHIKQQAQKITEMPGILNLHHHLLVQLLNFINQGCC